METTKRVWSPKDRFWTENLGNVRAYEYVCQHPNDLNYHIVLNSLTQEPERFFGVDMDRVYRNEEDAELKAAEYHIMHLKYLGFNATIRAND